MVTDSTTNEGLIQEAIRSSNELFYCNAWKHGKPQMRSEILHRWSSLIKQNRDALALLITLENGKPLKEALGEVLYACDYIDFYGSEATRIHGEFYPNSQDSSRRIVVKREPVGVVGMITPWNFPIAMIARKVAPAVAAGCCIVAKPAHQTPLSMLAIAILAKEAGFPAGLFNIVSGMNAALIGNCLTSSPLVQKISFTGSTAIGKRLFKQSSDTVKRLSLELGGNAPAIVFADADLDEAVSQIFSCKFRCSGQTCISANRIYVHASIIDRFREKFVAKVSSDLVMGHGADPGTTLGPLIDETALAKASNLVKGLDADVLLCGGKKATGFAGHFFEPTVIQLGNCTSRHPILQQELFSPIAVIIPFGSEEEVLACANGTSSGLASYVFTRDLARSLRIADELQFGMVGINDCAISDAKAPFGGIKESGFGREGSHHGIQEYLNLKYIKIKS